LTEFTSKHITIPSDSFLNVRNSERHVPYRFGMTVSEDCHRLTTSVTNLLYHV
jgi:hypothetical protein